MLNTSSPAGFYLLAACHAHTQGQHVASLRPRPNSPCVPNKNLSAAVCASGLLLLLLSCRILRVLRVLKMRRLMRRWVEAAVTEAATKLGVTLVCVVLIAAGMFYELERYGVSSGAGGEGRGGEDTQDKKQGVLRKRQQAAARAADETVSNCSCKAVAVHTLPVHRQQLSVLVLPCCVCVSPFVASSAFNSRSWMWT